MTARPNKEELAAARFLESLEIKTPKFPIGNVELSTSQPYQVDVFIYAPKNMDQRALAAALGEVAEAIDCGTFKPFNPDPKNKFNILSASVNVEHGETPQSVGEKVADAIAQVSENNREFLEQQSKEEVREILCQVQNTFQDGFEVDATAGKKPQLYATANGGVLTDAEVGKLKTILGETLPVMEKEGMKFAVEVTAVGLSISALPVDGNKMRDETAAKLLSRVAKKLNDIFEYEGPTMVRT